MKKASEEGKSCTLSDMWPRNERFDSDRQEKGQKRNVDGKTIRPGAQEPREKEGTKASANSACQKVMPSSNFSSFQSRKERGSDSLLSSEGKENHIHRAMQASNTLSKSAGEGQKFRTPLSNYWRGGKRKPDTCV